MKDVMVETRELVEGKRELTKPELQAMKLLLENYSMQEICKKMGIGKTTLWKITRDEFFKAELRSNQETVFNAALAVLVAETRSMAQALINIALDPEETSSVRIQAVKLAYASVLNMGSQMEFRQRLAALEQQFKDM